MMALSAAAKFLYVGPCRITIGSKQPRKIAMRVAGAATVWNEIAVWNDIEPKEGVDPKNES